MKTAAEFLEAAAGEFRTKNAVYGDNYLNVGKAMTAFFPNGIEVKTTDDWNRLHIFLLQIVKLTRYCNNWIAVDEKHVFARSDSMHDNTVYSAMLESIDAMIAEAMKLAPATQLEDDHSDPATVEACRPALKTVTIVIPSGYRDAAEFLKDCAFEEATVEATCMANGITCYENDEQLCELESCVRHGCRRAKPRVAQRPGHIEIERLNGLLADAQRIIAEYRERGSEVLRAELAQRPRLREALEAAKADLLARKEKFGWKPHTADNGG